MKSGSASCDGSPSFSGGRGRTATTIVWTGSTRPAGGGVGGLGVSAGPHCGGGCGVGFGALRGVGVNRREAIARVLGLNALEYSVLAPAALISALVLFVGAGGEGVQDGITLPWLLVVPGFLPPFWLTSPKRRGRLSAPR